MEIKIKYLDGAERLQKISVGDWIDLPTYESHAILKGGRGELNLGVAMELPKGYEAIIVPRSSTFKKFGILMTNGMGIIDNSYCGDNDIWLASIYATESTRIEKGDRLFQFRIQKSMPDITFTEVDSLENEDRGGFGTTGVGINDLKDKK